MMPLQKLAKSIGKMERKMKFNGKVKIKKKHQLNEDVFQLVIERHEAMGEIKAGQFFNITASISGFPLLRRPISVSFFNETSVEFTIKVLGPGTEALSCLSVNDQIEVMGPLGNGFDLDVLGKEGSKLLFVGGGIGVAPIKGLVESLSKSNHECDVILGFRDQPYLEDVFKSHSRSLMVVSENDDACLRGYVTEPFEEALKSNAYDMIFACGPEIMLRKLATIANMNDVKIQLLMEEKMACGIGACLVCTCKTKEGNFGFKHVRMCVEGPMFYGSEVIFDEA